MEPHPNTPNMNAEEFEARVEELERLAGSLAAAPDEELVGMLGRAVELVSGINAGVEAALRSAGEEARDLEEAVGRVNFDAFDVGLRDATADATDTAAGPRNADETGA